MVQKGAFKNGLTLIWVCNQGTCPAHGRKEWLLGFALVAGRSGVNLLTKPTEQDTPADKRALLSDLRNRQPNWSCRGKVGKFARSG